MKRFDFRLQSALRWRTLQQQQEQEKLSRAIAEETTVKRAIADLHRERALARETINSGGEISSADLRALSAFLLACDSREQALAQQLTVKRRQVAAQRAHLVEADRRLRLVEKLRERQFAEWSLATDRQLAAAAEETWAAVHQHD